MYLFFSFKIRRTYLVQCIVNELVELREQSPETGLYSYIFKKSCVSIRKGKVTEF